MATPPVDTNAVQTGKIPKKQFPQYYTIVLVALPIFAGLLAFMAMIGLQTDSSLMSYVKSAVVAGAAGLVSYCINRFAIDWGAELAANGYKLVGIFSVASIMIVGLCLWAFTYAGMVLPDVRILRLEDHGQHLASHVNDRNNASSKLTAIAPIIEAAGDDIAYHAACEQENSCVSGRGTGGRGTVARALEERAQRAGEIVKQIRDGQDQRGSLIGQINTLLAEYQSVVGNGSFKLSEKRARLMAIDGEIGQALASLEEAIPLGLAQAYAAELKGGITIEGRPKASNVINLLLGRHGKAIDGQLSKFERTTFERPAFPAKAGINDSFAYIDHFLAIAGIVAIVECVFPIALWLYTLYFLLRHHDLPTAKPVVRRSEPENHNSSAEFEPEPTFLNGNFQVPTRHGHHNRQGQTNRVRHVRTRKSSNGGRG